MAERTLTIKTKLIKNVLQYLRKSYDILIIIFVILVVSAIFLTLYGLNYIQKKYDGNPEEYIEFVSQSKSEVKPNRNLVEFLENPIDLNEYKVSKGQSLSSVTNGLDYHYKPEISNSIYYHYTAFPNDTLWNEIAPIDMVVFKYGKNKHTWGDETEILIEFTVSGKDSDLKKANLVGLTKAGIESDFGSDYKVFDNRIVYSNKNKALIIELENSKVKWFKYIKLSTENIDSLLTEKIIKNGVHQRLY